MNIVDIAAGSDDFNILVQALTTAGLVETIRTSTDITVFAPNDAAFTTLAVDLGFAGDTTDETAVFNHIAGVLASLDPVGDPVPLLSSILTYHVSGSVLDAAAVTAAATIPTLSAGNAITPDVPVLEDLEPDLVNPSLIQTDIPADNGILHVIDRVLLPLDVPGNDAPSITGLVAASGTGTDGDNTDFDILLAAVQTAGLDGVLDTAGLDATVFAPTDAAFIALARDLGYTGTDEAGALTAIVETLTALGGGDPIPLLTTILLYHVSPDAKQASQVLGLSEIETLQGGTFDVSGTLLVDNDPDLTDPALIATDIQASNGIVHAIDRVLIPVDIPASNGAGGQVILFGDAANGGSITGAGDNDILIGQAQADDFRGRAGADAFVLSNDNARDLIRDFEIGVDVIDVSAFADSFDDLTITNVVRKDGSVNWINISDQDHGSEFWLRFGDGTTLDAANLTADSFVFSDVPLPPPAPNAVQDTAGIDNLRGTKRDDVFAMEDDGLRDLIRGFELGTDAIDVSAIAGSIDDLTITNIARGDGTTSWISVADQAGEAEFWLRFVDETDFDAANLTEDSFVF